MKALATLAAMLIAVAELQAAQDCSAFRQDFAAAAREHFADVEGWDFAALLEAQAWVESRCNPQAESAAGAQGIAQFEPSTWRYVLGKHHLPNTTPFDPKAAIAAQGWYMRDLYDQVVQSLIGTADPAEAVPMALGAYNVGFGTIQAAGGLTPPASQYAKKILEHYHHGRAAPVPTAPHVAGPSLPLPLLETWGNRIASLVLLIAWFLVFDLLFGRQTRAALVKGNLAVSSVLVAGLLATAWIVTSNNSP